MKKIQIYILTRDRPNFLKESIKSLKKKDKSLNIEIIISDNSEFKSKENLKIANKYNVKYVLRNPPNSSAHKHFDQVVKESVSDFLMLFHDDDILNFDAIRSQSEILKSNNEIAAVACNAFFLKNNEKTNIKYMGKFYKDLIIEKNEDLLIPYLKYYKYKPPPFSGYMYRTEYIKKIPFLEFKKFGGKYSDVSFLLELLKFGKFYWINKPMMFYRIHSNNDSAGEKITERKKLINFICKNTNFTKSSLVFTHYRLKIWQNYLISNHNRKLKKKNIILFCLFIKQLFKLYIKDKDFRQFIFYKLINKLLRR